jgi:hypothetical protein
LHAARSWSGSVGSEVVGAVGVEFDVHVAFVD